MDRKQDYFLLQNNYLLDESCSPPRDGACKGMETKKWFSSSEIGFFSPAQQQARDAAISVCRSCAVRQQCLMYSLKCEPFGIWGGFTENQRTLLRVFWKIQAKRVWGITARLHGSRLIDYINHTEDIKFLKKVAHDQNLAQPSFNERPCLPSPARHRFRQQVAH